MLQMKKRHGPNGLALLLFCLVALLLAIVGTIYLLRRGDGRAIRDATLVEFSVGRPRRIFAQGGGNLSLGSIPPVAGGRSVGWLPSFGSVDGAHRVNDRGFSHRR